MNNRELIEIITREVMKILAETQKEKEKEKLLIVSSNKEQINNLKAKLGDEYDIQVSNSKSDFPKGYDQIIIGSTEEDERVCEEIKKTVVGDKLITEQKLRKHYFNGIREIEINKKSILTPLALDFIREHNMTISKQ